MTDALKAKVAERIAARKVLVVVGTGVSLASTGGETLASWKGLIVNGIERCAALGLRNAEWVASQKKLLEGDLDDLLGVAEQVSRRLGWKPTEPCGGDWNGWLRDTVGRLRAKDPELIKAIHDLGTPIATLNYDNLLTEVMTDHRPITWQRAERWLLVLQGEDQAILHLHGHWDHPSSVVLGIRSYDAVMGNNLAQHLQRALTSLRSLLFVGCSGTLEDQNFNALLTWMREHLGGAEHSHYLLIRESEPLSVAAPLLREARVVPLHYGKAHADLLPFIRDLAPKPPGPAQIAPRFAGGHGQYLHQLRARGSGAGEDAHPSARGCLVALPMTQSRRVFLAHAREDKERVRTLYKQIKQHGFSPWLDEEDLIPGQIWQIEIQKAIREAGAFIACLSQISVQKQGYVQNEFRQAMKAYGEKPPGAIYFIPVRLDECEIPDLQIPNQGLSLRDFHWLDLWQEGGIERLIRALEKGPGRAESTATSAFKTRNVVLVHGVFDRSSWSGVVERLQAAGLQVVAVQNPLTSLTDDVRATRRVLAMQDGPTVLVGHSYGGTVISAVGVDPKVTGLVYVAALAPEAGEDLGKLATQFPPTPAGASIRVSGGFAQLDEAGFIANFAQDVPPAQARVLAASQGPFEQNLFRQKTTVAAWKEKPSWYAVSTKDRFIDPDLERFFADRMKAHTVEVNASHASPVSQPSAIAELIKLAARA